MKAMWMGVVSVLVGFAGASLAWQGTAPAKPATLAPAPPAPTEEKKAVDPFVLRHTVKTIDGQDKDLREYEGKAVLIVNVASQCGYTYQYKGLQNMFAEFKDKGLVVLGFPSNDFGNQEPGTEKEIVTFCQSHFKDKDGAALEITFPMFSKMVVTGEKASPLFASLAAQPGSGAPNWNFNKYLVGRDGKLIARFESRVKPEDEAFRGAVLRALGLEAETPKPAPAATPAK